MMEKLETSLAKLKPYAPAVLRMGISAVFIWFGSQQLMHPLAWQSFVPASASALTGLSALALVHVNGAFEVIFGIALFLGLFPQLTSFLLALHMLDITWVVGYGAIGARDLGLSIAAISIFMNGPDIFCLSNLLEGEKSPLKS